MKTIIFMLSIFVISCQSSDHVSSEDDNIDKENFSLSEGKNINILSENQPLVQGKREPTSFVAEKYIVNYEAPKEFKTISKLEIIITSLYEENYDFYFSVWFVCANHDNQIISDFSYKTKPHTLSKQSKNKIVFDLPPEFLSQNKTCQGGLSITTVVIEEDGENSGGKKLWLKYKYDHRGNLLFKEHPSNEDYLSVEIAN